MLASSPCIRHACRLLRGFPAVWERPGTHEGVNNVSMCPLVSDVQQFCQSYYLRVHQWKLQGTCQYVSSCPEVALTSCIFSQFVNVNSSKSWLSKAFP